MFSITTFSSSQIRVAVDGSLQCKCVHTLFSQSPIATPHFRLADVAIERGTFCSSGLEHIFVVYFAKEEFSTLFSPL
jgi:hypothetical protein